MYSGALLVVLLSPFVLGSWVAIPLPFPLIAVIIIRLLDEEKYLSANLKGYQEYCQKVHYHLIPGIW
jgi:protein-S-isoprenylcysteine O-methyltransferase Ste14